jgi:hypothetical protein
MMGMTGMMATLVAALTLTLFLVPPASAARGYSTRYWDCCKVHCAWPANVRGVASVAKWGIICSHMPLVALNLCVSIDMAAGAPGQAHASDLCETTPDTHHQPRFLLASRR